MTEPATIVATLASAGLELTPHGVAVLRDADGWVHTLQLARPGVTHSQVQFPDGTSIVWKSNESPTAAELKAAFHTAEIARHQDALNQ